MNCGHGFAFKRWIVCHLYQYQSETETQVETQENCEVSYAETTETTGSCSG